MPPCISYKREWPLPLTRDEIGLCLDRTVLSQRKSENICVPSVVQLGAASGLRRACIHR